MVTSTSLHLDSAAEVTYDFLHQADLSVINISDYHWDDKNGTRVEADLKILISHKRNVMRQLDDIIAAFQKVRQQFLTDAEDQGA